MHFPERAFLSEALAVDGVRRWSPRKRGRKQRRFSMNSGSWQAGPSPAMHAAL
jgi:hypothetical protein